MKPGDFIFMKKVNGTENDAEPWEYNFEFECGDENYKALPVFERYFTYKISPEVISDKYDSAKEFIKKHFGYSSICDPDGSAATFYPIIHDIYNKLWNWEKSKDTFGRINNEAFDDILWGGDTMNSVQTTLGWISGSQHSSLYFTLNNWWGDKETFEKKMMQLKVDEYINSYHTLGNFVLVPRSFNSNRSRWFGDFWDRSLQHLKENGYNDFISDYFAKYINYFFLWDYAIIDKESYSVKDLSHGLKYGTEHKEFTPFYEKASKYIKRRGRFMTAMLIIQTKNSKLYKEIQTWLVDKSTLLKGIDDAAKKILQEFKGISDDENLINAKKILNDFALP